MSTSEQQLPEVDKTSKRQKGNKFLHHHDEQGLLLNGNSESVSQKFSSAPPRTLKKSKISKNSSCCSIFFIYVLLIIVASSIIYFNLQVYESYLDHNSFVVASLNSTRLKITEGEKEINAYINSFVGNYSQHMQQLKTKLKAIDAKIEDIKKQSQEKIDRIQAISTKNQEQLAQLNTIQHEHKIYANEIKDYHREVELKNQ